MPLSTPYRIALVATFVGSLALVANSCRRNGGGGAQAAFSSRRLGSQDLSADEARAERERRAVTLYGYRGTVSGRVTLADGRSPEGLIVKVRFTRPASGMTGEGDARVAKDGTYTVRGLSSTRFWVGVGTKGYLAPPARMVDLTKSSAILGVDFALPLGPLVTVRARETITGRPLSGMTLRVSSREPWVAPVATVTGPDGRASVRAGSLQLDIVVGDAGGRYLGMKAQALSEHRDLARSAPVFWDVRLNDSQGPKEVAFRGVVLTPDGRPASGAELTFYRNTERQTSITGPDGVFAFKARRFEWPEEAGSSGALLIAEKGGLRAFHTWVPDAPWTTTKLTLAPDDRATLSGRVVDERGRPIARCRIFVGGRYPQFEGSSYEIQSRAFTGSDGRFSIPGLDPRARYRFSFGGVDDPGTDGPGPLGTTEIPPFRSPEPGMRAPAPFRPFAPRELRKLGNVLVPHGGRRVSGTVAGPNGKPLRGTVVVNLVGDHTDAFSDLDGTGRFAFENAANEPLVLRVVTVKVSPGARPGEWAGNANPGSPDILLARPVKAGATGLRLTATYRPPKR